MMNEHVSWSQDFPPSFPPTTAVRKGLGAPSGRDAMVDSRTASLFLLFFLQCPLLELLWGTNKELLHLSGMILLKKQSVSSPSSRAPRVDVCSADLEASHSWLRGLPVGVSALLHPSLLSLVHLFLVDVSSGSVHHSLARQTLAPHPTRLGHPPVHPGRCWTSLGRPALGAG